MKNDPHERCSCYAPAKQSQHLNATFPNIIGPAFGSSSQMITTFECNKSQHSWAQNVSCIWPTCCDVLGVVGSDLKMVKFEPATPNALQQGGQTHATCFTQQCYDMLR